MKLTFSIIFSFIIINISAQLRWKNVDSLYSPLPENVHVYFTNDSLDGKPNIAYYLKAKLKDKKLDFTVDTTLGRRLTPEQFYIKNKKPLVVVNTTFFSFETNKNLNLVIKKGKVVGYNIHDFKNKGKDTLTYTHVFPSAIGISKKRNADIAWTYTDSSSKKVRAIQYSLTPYKDSVFKNPFEYYNATTSFVNGHQGDLISLFNKWKMKTAVGGGPVLVQNGEIYITNNEERKFAGKAIDDKHPRTAMGYTKDGYLIILVVQGRTKGIADGVTLKQEAQILKDLGCVEALNLDGGGSSCLLINGKETIAPSDKKQRPVPAVFMINQ